MGTNEHFGIKSWAVADRPREKLLIHGRRHLTDAELTAILIGSGSKNETAVELSKRILKSFNNDLNTFGKVSVKELSKFKGIGVVKAMTIVAALELGRRRSNTAAEETFKISSSQDIYRHLLPFFADLDHEEFWIVLLNRANNVLSSHQVSRGGRTGTVADPKIIFKIALENNAASIIAAHNHPSGQLQPSDADIAITNKLVSAGKFLDLSLLDHLIVTNTSYYSFADEGRL